MSANTAGVENSAYWAELAPSYTTADWLALTAYAVGAKVVDPDTQIQYQCHTAHTSGAAFATTHWGVLVPLTRYIAYEQTGKTAIGGVQIVAINDPDNRLQTPFKIDHIGFNADGILVPTFAPATVYVKFRRRPYQYTATEYVNAASYAVGDLVYYSPEAYRCIQVTTGNHLPTEAAYWVKVDFPLILADFCQRAAFSDWLRDQKQTARANAEEARAWTELQARADRELDQQGVYETASVQTYGSR